MKTSFHLALALCCVVTPSAMAQSAPRGAVKTKGATSKGAGVKDAPSTEDKVKAEFAAWRYAGAKISASFGRGPLSLLSITTGDDMEKVWKFYVGRIPTENKLPLGSSWDIPGDNTFIGANYSLGSSYAVSLNSAPREGGTIVYQKGSESVVIEIRARTPEQSAATGVATDIKLIKMKPLDAPKPGAGENPVQGAASPASTW